MASTGLYGPHDLTELSINLNVGGIGPGAYALGYLNDAGNLVVQRVGRSDNDLSNRLHDYIGQYRVFKFAFFNSAKDAFEKECQLYHDFMPEDNINHPDRPTATNYSCPVCGS